jgi:hypothetical protein
METEGDASRFRERLAGKVAVITGSTSGIGRACAALFAAAGAQVIVVSCPIVAVGSRVAPQGGPNSAQMSLANGSDQATLKVGACVQFRFMVRFAGPGSFVDVTAQTSFFEDTPGAVPLFGRSSGCPGSATRPSPLSRARNRSSRPRSTSLRSAGP